MLNVELVLGPHRRCSSVRESSGPVLWWKRDIKNEKTAEGNSRELRWGAEGKKEIKKKKKSVYCMSGTYLTDISLLKVLPVDKFR